MSTVSRILNSSKWASLSKEERTYVMNVVTLHWLDSSNKTIEQFISFYTEAYTDNEIFNLWSAQRDKDEHIDYTFVIHLALASKYKGSINNNENNIVDHLLDIYDLPQDMNPPLPQRLWTNDNQITVAIRGPLETRGEFAKRLKTILQELGQWTFNKFVCNPTYQFGETWTD